MLFFSFLLTLKALNSDSLYFSPFKMEVWGPADNFSCMFCFDFKEYLEDKGVTDSNTLKT